MKALADEGEGEPRVGRKALFFLLLGVVVAIFLPILGLVVLIFLVLAWILLVLVWVVSGARVRRPILYITAFTAGFLGTLLLFGLLKVSIFAVAGG